MAMWQWRLIQIAWPFVIAISAGHWLFLFIFDGGLIKLLALWPNYVLESIWSRIGAKSPLFFYFNEIFIAGDSERWRDFKPVSFIKSFSYFSAISKISFGRKIWAATLSLGFKPAVFLADWISRIRSRSRPSSFNFGVIFVSNRTSSFNVESKTISLTLTSALINAKKSAVSFE